MARRHTLAESTHIPYAVPRLSAANPDGLLITDGPRSRTGILMITWSARFSSTPPRLVDPATQFFQGHTPVERVQQATPFLLPHLLSSRD